IIFTVYSNEIKYTGFRDRPHEERQARFGNACRDGRSEIAFVATGTNLSLQFFPPHTVCLQNTAHVAHTPTLSRSYPTHTLIPL
uniref:Core-binding factor subunit beta n=1 Tax=Sinocyclocheilus grahami TaxID=75366 RepID=A0A672KKS3_SINGR